MAFPLLLLATLALLSYSAHSFDFPDCTVAPLAGTPVCDEGLHYLARARWIVSQMNVSEKALRLQNSSPGIDRLGLPWYEWWNEALHGLAYSPGISFTSSGNFSCATSFPMPIGLGASFDRQLVHDTAAVTATEGRAFSNYQLAGLDLWTPMINIFRDPRWGRGEECPSEDPYLSAEYVYYLIRGYQEGEDNRYYKVVAQCKAYTVYDLETWNSSDRHSYNAIVSNQDLVETYLPGFKSCLKDAKVGSIMCSYNAVNGVPMCANEFLLNQVARGQWGWDGWITSDCNAITGILEDHHYVQNHSAQVQVALRAGVDIGCDVALSLYSEQAYDDGSITDYDLDLALTRQFSSLIRLGLFDSPVNQPYRQYGAERVATEEAIAVSMLAALKSVVLLKNDGTLPLSQSSVRIIALIGPNADAAVCQLGNYYGQACFMTTPLSALSGLQGVQVNYSFGTDIAGSSRDGFAAAIAAAQSADAIVYVGGMDQTVESEANDRTSIDLPGVQAPLIHELAQAGKPLVVVLYGGGGMDVSDARDSDAVNAILWHGYPSQSGGDALAEVLFGRYSPAGKLPATWYPANYVDLVPMTDQSMRPSPTNPGRTYKFYTGDAVFPFGYGLTYSTFTYGVLPDQTASVYQIKDLSANARLDDRLTDVSLTVNVTNTGKLASEVVVLAYVSSSVSPAGVSPPIKELFDYARPMLAPGESIVLVFGLSYRVLAHVDQDGHQWLLPGQYKLAVNNEEDVVHRIELHGEAVMIEEFPTQHAHHSVSAEPVRGAEAALHRHDRVAD